MEVKLSISSSRRISFASDFKDLDLEVERKYLRYNNNNDDNDHNGRRFSEDLDDDDEDDFMVFYALIFYVNVRLVLESCESRF